MELVNPLTQSIDLLNQYGLFTVILPALLIFVIVFGILQKTKLLAKDDDAKAENVKPLHGAIAAIVALLFVTQTDVVQFISNMLPSATSILVVILAVMLILGFLGFSTSSPLGLLGDDKTRWLRYTAAIVVGFIFLSIVDLAMGWQIPIVHQLTQIFLGQTAIVLPSVSVPGVAVAGMNQDAINLLIAMLIIIGLPAIIIYFLLRRSTDK